MDTYMKILMDRWMDGQMDDEWNITIHKLMLMHAIVYYSWVFKMIPHCGPIELFLSQASITI